MDRVLDLVDELYWLKVLAVISLVFGAFVYVSERYHEREVQPEIAQAAEQSRQAVDAYVKAALPSLLQHKTVYIGDSNFAIPFGYHAGEAMAPDGGSLYAALRESQSSTDYLSELVGFSAHLRFKPDGCDEAAHGPCALSIAVIPGALPNYSNDYVDPYVMEVAVRGQSVRAAAPSQ